MHLVLGVDAGGTSSRAALFTLDGTLVRRGDAGGANPGALGMDTAAANLTTAVRPALPESGSAQLMGVVAGLAGNPDRCAALAGRVFDDLLPGVPVRVAGDIVTAFAAGTASPSGTVVISGTGAIAAKITDHVPIATADGYGWLLGDEGSAFWIGRAAVRATIRALTTLPSRPSPTTPVGATPGSVGVVAAPGTVRAGGVSGGGVTVGDAGTGDGAGPGGLGAGWVGGAGGMPDAEAGWKRSLAGSVVRHLLPDGIGGDPVARLAAAVHARPPLALAELAPLVSRAARDGDPAAVSIVAEAASRLARTASRVHQPGLPIVLAGGVLTAEGPVRESVQGLLEGAVTAGDPAGAAAWLAARPLVGPRESAALHLRFTRSP
ncbi:N-acetylglucosamine kinase [Nonomuraea diastatica]|nr:BadF/BadG/BcrA/BcrD ATPase family protein [Nonomuraea diastatica]